MSDDCPFIDLTMAEVLDLQSWIREMRTAEFHFNHTSGRLDGDVHPAVLERLAALVASYR